MVPQQVHVLQPKSVLPFFVVKIAVSIAWLHAGLELHPPIYKCCSILLSTLMLVGGCATSVGPIISMKS